MIQKGFLKLITRTYFDAGKISFEEFNKNIADKVKKTDPFWNQRDIFDDSQVHIFIHEIITTTNFTLKDINNDAYLYGTKVVKEKIECLHNNYEYKYLLKHLEPCDRRKNKLLNNLPELESEK
ncbi:hypothetical protein ACXR6G_11530 [Ancylomarina sp. YFZ004]